MIFLKACPECRGELIQDSDLYGRYVRCLQCGLMKDIGGKGEEVPTWLDVEAA